jgi:hypothetical protein
MIKIYVGNVGSGKTLMAVHDMLEDSTTTYTNIYTNNIPHVIRLDKSMLIKQTIIGMKRNGEEILKSEFNKEFWLDVKEKHKKINVILDEAHSLLNARRSTSTQNIILNDFLSLIRKFLGSSNEHGHLLLITQLSNKIDLLARDMATFVQFHVGHYIYQCLKCRYKYISNSEMSLCDICPNCRSPNVYKIKTRIEVWQFNNMEDFEIFKFLKKKTYFNRFTVDHPEKIYNNFDTMQWDNLF